MLIAVIVFLNCFMLPSGGECAESEDLLSKLKVAYIYNFTRFIEWPEAPAGRPFVIGMIGDAGMEARLRILEQEDKRVDDRPIQIRAFAVPDLISRCEVLFVGSAAEYQLDAIIRGTSGGPTLLVGDTPGYGARGVAIELFPKSDIFRKTERLRFRINRAALRNRGLVVSAQLYDVAEVIE